SFAVHRLEVNRSSVIAVVIAVYRRISPYIVTVQRVLSDQAIERVWVLGGRSLSSPLQFFVRFLAFLVNRIASRDITRCLSLCTVVGSLIGYRGRCSFLFIRAQGLYRESWRSIRGT